MFSVIIPLYNKAEYISQAIRSVLGQTCNDFELIIIDDGSTDNSLEVVRQFSDARIRIINQENAGVSTARNNGAKEAKYEYIAFLDADDWWDINYLEEMQLLIHKYPDAGLWAAKYYKVKDRRNIEANIGLEKNFIEGYINYFEVYAKTMWMPVTSSSFIMPVKYFNDLGSYKAGLKIGEDFDLWVRIALKYKIAYLNNTLVYYNQDVNANNRAVGRDRIWKPENHYIFHLGHLGEEEKTNPDLKILLDKLRLRALFRYHLQGKYREEKKRALSEVDFSKQTLRWRFKYKMPLLIIMPLYSIKKHLSIMRAKYINFKKQSA